MLEGIRAMYLFNYDEADSIKKRVEDVSPYLRGWTLDKRFNTLRNLNISEITNTFCRTDRKIFQTYKGVNYGTSEAMVIGASIHSVVEEVFDSVVFDAQESRPIHETLAQLKNSSGIEQQIWIGGKMQGMRNLYSSDAEYVLKLNNLKDILREIIDFEVGRFSDPTLNGQVKILDLERFVHGLPLAVSYGKIDVVFRYNGMLGIGDLKTGRPWKDNWDAKLQMAVYALLLESEVKREVDWGVAIFPFDSSSSIKSLRKRPLKDIFGIGDELRIQALQRLTDVDNMLSSGAPPEICDRCSTRDLCSRVI